MLVNGKWSPDWHPLQARDPKGGFVRQDSRFRSWVTPDGRRGPTGEEGFAAEAGRYHLYVALTCPWASRALVGRKLKKLEGAISISVVEPVLTSEGWRSKPEKRARFLMKRQTGVVKPVAKDVEFAKAEVAKARALATAKAEEKEKVEV